MSNVKELNEIVVFGCRMSVAIDKSLEDKKVSVSDMAHFISPLMAAGDAFTDAKGALKELEKLDAEGMKRLARTIERELNISSGKTKKIAKKVVIAAMGVYLSYRDISSLTKGYLEKLK